MSIYSFLFQLFLLTNIFVQFSLTNPTTQPKIAVIGSGIAGSSTVHYLKQTFQNIDITLFEKENILGGRTHTYNLNEHNFEIGASFIISQNYHILDLLSELNLTAVAISDLEDKKMGIFDTEKNQFFYKQSAFSKIISLIKLAWNFGPISLWKLKSSATKKLNDFLKIYEIQNSYDLTPFDSLEEFLRFVNLEDSIQKSGTEYLKNDINLDEKIVEKLIRSVNMNFYSQNLEEVNGFTGTITLEGFASDGLIVKEGLNQISERLLNQLYKKSINLKKNTRVLSIQKSQISDKFNLQTKNKQTEQEELIENFDVVIIAAPLEMAKISFDEKIKISSKNFKKNDFESVYKYLVVGQLNPQTFNEQNNEDLPENILMTRKLFGKIALIAINCRKCHQMKNSNEKGDLIMIKASYPLEQTELEKILQNSFEIIKEFSVKMAYPTYKNTINNLTNLPDIVLAKGIYYVNSLEFLASCIEVEAISAKNIVQLIYQNEGSNWDLNQNLQQEESSKSQQQSKSQKQEM